MTATYLWPKLLPYPVEVGQQPEHTLHASHHHQSVTAKYICCELEKSEACMMQHSHGVNGLTSNATNSPKWRG